MVSIDSGVQKNHGLPGKSKISGPSDGKQSAGGFENLMQAALQGSVKAEGNPQQIKAGQHTDDDSSRKESDDSSSIPNEDHNQVLKSDCDASKCIAGWLSPQNTASIPTNQGQDGVLYQETNPNTAAINPMDSMQAAESILSTSMINPSAGGIEEYMAKNESILPASESDTGQPAPNDGSNIPASGKDGSNSQRTMSPHIGKLGEFHIVDQDPIEALKADLEKSDTANDSALAADSPIETAKDAIDMRNSGSERIPVEIKDPSIWVQAAKSADSVAAAQPMADNHSVHISTASITIMRPDPESAYRFVRIAKVEVTNNGGNMFLRLDPPHLGTLRMDVSTVDGLLTAHIYTGTESARQLLQSDVNSLKEMIHRAGITVDSINIAMENRSASDSDLQNGSTRYAWEDRSNMGSDAASGHVTDTIRSGQMGIPSIYIKGLFDFFA